MLGPSFSGPHARASRLSLQVECGVYLPGRIGIKSLMGLPKIHCTGKSFVSRLGVFRYWSTARRCSLFVSCVVSYEAYDCFYSTELRLGNWNVRVRPRILA